MSFRTLYIGCCIVAAAGVVAGFQRQVKQTPTLRLSVDTRRLDIGSQWAQADFPWELAVNNDEEQALHVLGIRSTCACVGIHPDSFTIPPNSTRTLLLTLDLDSSENASETPETPFSVTLRPQVANVPDTSVTSWRITGRVRHAGACSPRTVHLTGTNSLIQHRQPTASTVQINWFIPVENVTVTSDGDRFSVRLSATSSTKTALAIMPFTPTESGEFAENLYVTATEQGESAPLPPLKIPIYGHALSDLYTTPDVLDVGVLSMGEISHRSLAFDTYSERKPTGVGVDKRMLGDGLRASVDDSAAIASIEYTARTPGPISEKVVLVARFKDGSSVVHSVPVMGYVAADRNGVESAGRNRTETRVVRMKVDQ